MRDYGKYIFKRIRRGKTEIFARVGFLDKNGIRKYRYKRAKSEEEALELVEDILRELRIEDFENKKLENEQKSLEEIFLAVRNRKQDFREFKNEIYLLFLG